MARPGWRALLLGAPPAAVQVRDVCRERADPHGRVPSFCLYRDIVHTMPAETSLAVTRVYAVEGQCFVVAATQVAPPEIFFLLADTDEKAALLNSRKRGPGGGFSMIYGPDGRELAAHLPENEEELVVAGLDFSTIALAKSAANPAGHYARPDVLKLLINREERQPIQNWSMQTRTTQRLFRARYRGGRGLGARRRKPCALSRLRRSRRPACCTSARAPRMCGGTVRPCSRIRGALPGGRRSRPQAGGIAAGCALPRRPG